MGCCSSSNRIEQVVITKAEKEDLKTKTDNQLLAKNELKIIELELETSIEFLIANMLTTHSIIIEYLLYFLDCLNESIQKVFSKGVDRDIDTQALKIIRVALQKLQGLLKNEENIHQVEEDSSNGIKINKVLQDLELNIKVIVKGNLQVLITKDILKEITLLKEFTLFLAAVFWKENICKITNSPNFYMQWQEFKEKFLDFTKKYFQIELNERIIEFIRKMLDNNEDQRIFYKDFENFLVNNWLSSKKRKDFLLNSQKENSKKKELLQRKLNFTHFEFNTNTNKYEKVSQINLQILEQSLSPNNIISKNLCEEGFTFGINNCDVPLNIHEDQIIYNEKCLVFYKQSSQKYYLSNIAKDVPCKYLLSSKKKINMKPDLLLQISDNLVKIERIEEDSCICGLYDSSYNLLREIILKTNNYKEEFIKLGSCEGEFMNIWIENNEWFMNIENKAAKNLDNCIYVILCTFSELMNSYQTPFRNNIMQGVELENNMILNLSGKIFFVSGKINSFFRKSKIYYFILKLFLRYSLEGEYQEPDFSNFTKAIISESIENKQLKKTTFNSPQKENNHKVVFAENLEEIQIEKNNSTNKKLEAKKTKLNKSRSALLHDQKSIVTSKGKKIKK